MFKNQKIMPSISILLSFSFMTLLGSACNSATSNSASVKPATTSTTMDTQQPNTDNKLETIVLGGGCFWCVEAIYQDLKGVEKVVSGYAGGSVSNPTYREVCTGTTGHAEVLQISYDPAIISLQDILQIFFTVHDPTTLNRQGADVGTQYRSVIFYNSAEEKAIAEAAKTEAQEIWDDAIVTEIVPATTFYPAEQYHQNYYKDNPYQPYCNIVITPKVKKFRAKYQDKLKQ